MPLVDQFREVEAAFPEAWDTVRLRLTIPDEGECERAAALLGPVNPGRHGKVIHVELDRRAGIGPDRIRALLRRLDSEGIDGRLELAGVREAEAVPTGEQPGLASAWDEALATLPPDWSDLYAEVELTSSDHIEPGALRLSPLNPTRPGARPLFRFRVARLFGYGAAPEMARRCLERLDEAGIRGELRVIHVLSDTHPANTQGPVWYAGGKVI
jgi:hypothetical protein